MVKVTGGGGGGDWGREVVPMSDVNFNIHSCCLSLQVLDKNKEKNGDRICSILQ